jgi:hypothetical protein
MKEIKPKDRLTLIFWIAFLDLAYEYPGVSRMIRGIFLLEAQRKLTQDLLDGFDVELKKLREEVAVIQIEGNGAHQLNRETWKSFECSCGLKFGSEELFESHRRVENGRN